MKHVEQLHPAALGTYWKPGDFFLPSQSGFVQKHIMVPERNPMQEPTTVTVARNPKFNPATNEQQKSDGVDGAGCPFSVRVRG